MSTAVRRLWRPARGSPSGPVGPRRGLDQRRHLALGHAEQPRGRTGCAPARSDHRARRRRRPIWGSWTATSRLPRQSVRPGRPLVRPPGRRALLTHRAARQQHRVQRDPQEATDPRGLGRAGLRRTSLLRRAARSPSTLSASTTREERRGPRRRPLDGRCRDRHRVRRSAARPGQQPAHEPHRADGRRGGQPVHATADDRERGQLHRRAAGEHTGDDPPGRPLGRDAQPGQRRQRGEPGVVGRRRRRRSGRGCGRRCASARGSRP